MAIRSIGRPQLSTRFFIASGCPIATTTRYRCIHLQEQLEFLGYKAEVAEWFDEARIDPAAALRYDILFLYRLAMCSPLRRLIDRAHELGKPVIFDTDDLIFEPELLQWHRGVSKLSQSEQQLHAEGVERYRATLEASDTVTTATPLLAEFASRRGRPAFVHRNALGKEMITLADQLYQRRRQPAPNDKVIIGYGSGTPTHDVDFLEVSGALVNVLGQHPQVELWIVGPLALPAELGNFGDRVRLVALTSWRGWFELMSQMDILLAPLEMGNIFCRAKSEIKFVEAAVLGRPVVASKIDPFTDTIAEGETGLLAADEKEWRHALTWLIAQPERRWLMGEQARRAVLRDYSLETRATNLAQILPQLTKKSPS